MKYSVAGNRATSVPTSNTTVPDGASINVLALYAGFQFSSKPALIRVAEGVTLEFVIT